MEDVKRSDTICVIHFWATWCKPCLKQVPQIQALAKNYAQQKIRIYMVSLDKGKNAPAVVAKSLSVIAPNITSIILSDKLNASLIRSVDPNWDGGLPATLLVDPARNKRYFKQGDLAPDDVHAFLTGN